MDDREPRADRPRADRPLVPDGYGVPETTDGLRPWWEVEARLREDRVVWLATVRPDGRPHVVPRWGAWLDGAWWYDGSPDTVHVRNLRGDPRCVLHLPDGDDVVVLEGRASPVPQAPPLDLRKRLSAEMGRRYGPQGYAPEPDAWTGAEAGGLCVFRADKALTWSSFPADATRFRFASTGAS